MTKAASPSAAFPPPSLRVIAALPRSEDWARVAWRALADAARARTPACGNAGTYASDIGLTREAGATSLGHVIEVLERGPESADERELARSLAASAIRFALTQSQGSVDEAVRAAVWLAAHSAFDASNELGQHLSNAAVANALAERAVMSEAAGTTGTAARGEALVAASILGAAGLGTMNAALEGVKDPIVKRLLTSSAVAGPPSHEPIPKTLRMSSAPPPPTASSSSMASAGAASAARISAASASASSSGGTSHSRIEGDVERGPRAAWLTTLLALTGLLFVMHAVRLVARFALRYRRSGELTLEGGHLHIHTRTEMLGRTLKESDATLLATGLRRLARETSYPRLAFYGGLVSLALGTAIGVWFIADGVRAASPSLLGWGLLSIVVGAGIDFWTSSLRSGATGAARLVVEPIRGASFAVVGADADRIDEFLRAATP